MKKNEKKNVPPKAGKPPTNPAALQQDLIKRALVSPSAGCARCDSDLWGQLFFLKQVDVGVVKEGKNMPLHVPIQAWKCEGCGFIARSVEDLGDLKPIMPQEVQGG